MKKQCLATMIIAGTMLFAACKKNDGPAPENPIQDTRDFMDKAGPQKQTFTVAVSELPKTITLKGGIKITIPAGAFTKNGALVTGNVSVEAVELMKRSDLVLFGANTNHISGAPLQSDGSFLLEVKSNGESVDNKLAAPVRVAVPAKRDGATQLWVGVDSVQGNQFAWQAPQQGVPREVKMDQGQFAFDFGNLGWVNCDIFWSWANPKTTVKVNVPNNPGSMASFRAFTGETFVFFIAKNATVVAQLYTPDGVNQVKSYDNMMPVGAEGRLISFSIKNGKYYFVKKDITITAGQLESLTLSETTESALQAEITALDNL